MEIKLYSFKEICLAHPETRLQKGFVRADDLEALLEAAFDSGAEMRANSFKDSHLYEKLKKSLDNSQK